MPREAQRGLILAGLWPDDLFACPDCLTPIGEALAERGEAA